jgi:RimJ/RimL family protein N-acetyltransferase
MPMSTRKPWIENAGRENVGGVGLSNLSVPGDSNLSRLKRIAESSRTKAIEEALRLGVWTAGSPAHSEEVLCYCAGLAVEVDEWRLAGLAAYQAQRLHLARQGDPARWGLPMLPGLEVAGHQFNLVRHVPLRSRNVVLRRLEPEDRPFLLELFGNPRFLSQYSRPAHGRVESRIFQLLDNHHPFPKRVGAWNWLVCDAHGRQIGLLEISSLNFYQGSAELALGFKHSRFGTLAAEAYLFAACIAFHHLDLQVLACQVYADNTYSNQLVVRTKMQKRIYGGRDGSGQGDRLQSRVDHLCDAAGRVSPMAADRAGGRASGFNNHP